MKGSTKYWLCWRHERVTKWVNVAGASLDSVTPARLWLSIFYQQNEEIEEGMQNNNRAADWFQCLLLISDSFLLMDPEFLDNGSIGDMNICRFWSRAVVTTFHFNVSLWLTIVIQPQRKIQGESESLCPKTLIPTEVKQQNKINRKIKCNDPSMQQNDFTCFEEVFTQI